MHQDEELHAEIMRLFRLYFEQNQKWLNEGTKRAGMDTRALLSEIRRVCTQRRASIMEWRRWKDIDMAEKKARKHNQKGSTGED